MSGASPGQQPLNGVAAVSVLMLWIAGVLAIALAWWALRRAPARARVAAQGHSQPPQRVAVAPRPKAPVAAPVQAVPEAVTRVQEPLPAELASFRWRRVHDLDAARRDALLVSIKGIPRPPSSMQQLLSPEFIAKAGSGELSELVMGEPVIAARVLSAVNAPFYGLHKPVTNIGQAVTFMGMNTVRSICLQYLLAEAFKPGLAGSQKTFDAIWRASAVASELCVRLAKALNLPDQGGLATQVVLGFVGHLAAASLIPSKSVDEWLSLDRLQRTQKEQDLLGLGASEIGAQLLKTWELPAGLIEDVRGTDRVLITPPAEADAERAPRQALCYLCARLGERLALGQLATLEGYDAFADAGADSFHLRAYLSHPTLARLNAALASTELQNAMQQMLTDSNKAD